MEPDLHQTEVVVDPNLGELDPDTAIQPKKRFWLWFVLFDVVIFTPFLIMAGLFYLWQSAPADFEPITVVVEPGESVMQISQKLTAANIVQSEHVLFAILRYHQDPTQIKASTYNFAEPQSAFEVAQTLIQGEFDNDLTAVTFIEGKRARDYAATAAKTLPQVNEQEFLKLTADLEGQLFPETYFVPDDFSTEQLVALLTDTHAQTMAELLTTASTSLSDEEIIILASIVEREANTPESMATVSGVFLNRIAIGMPLQADASIEYVIDTPLGELAPGQLAAELRELDSPYNTYLNPGLPPTPIGNPGRAALAAVINPIKSDYLYYITGDDGEFYYAKTYSEHLTNIERHLR